MKEKDDFAYQAVYRYLVRLINEVQTDSTLKLPSLRQLARRLRVSISTIQSAYSLLEQEGRICSIPKSGYFALPGTLDDALGSDAQGGVLERLYRHVRRPGVTMLSGDEPHLLLSLEGTLQATERDLLRQYPRPLDCGFQPFGDVELRNALAARYTRDPLNCWHAEQVYIGPDLLGMLQAVVHVLDLSGRCVVVESPCHWTLLRLLQALNVQVLELPLAEDASVCPGGLERMLLEHPVGLAILSSRFNPLCGTRQPAANRRALAQVLNRHGVWVLENDNHGALAFDTDVPPLRDLVDPQRLLILGSFDKVLGPEAPYGYLLCRHFDARWHEYFQLRVFDLPPVRQKAIARLCNSGRLDQHLAELRQALQQRMHLMAELLDRHLGCWLRYELPVGGSGIWAQVPRDVDLRQVFETLSSQRLIIAPGELFSLGGLHRQQLRISYALDWTQDVERCLMRLAETLQQTRR